MKKNLITTLSAAYVVFAFAASSFAQMQTPDYPWDHDECYDDCDRFNNSITNPAALPDGTPHSVTGSVTRIIQNEHGLNPTPELSDSFPELVEVDTVDGSPTVEAVTGSTVGLIIGRGWFEAGDVDGNVNSFTVPYKHVISDRFTLHTTLPIQYSRVEDPAMGGSRFSVWSGGLLVGGAYGIAIPADKKDYRWWVTPTVGAVFMNASSVDVGTWNLVAGISSNFLYRINSRVILNVGNSYTGFYVQKLRSDYLSPMRSNQSQLINGAQLIFPMGRWVSNVFVIDNRYLSKAAVRNYQTYGLGVGYRVGKTASLRAYYYTDRGSDYRAHSFGVSSAWKF